MKIINSPVENDIKIVKWKVREGTQITMGNIILMYEILPPDASKSALKRLKINYCGIVNKLFFKDGEVVKKGSSLLELTECLHTTVIKDMCADCGADLRQNEELVEASVPMIHSVPDLKVTQELAEKLGKADTDRLLNDRKLVLLVDLDQTLIHTTNDNIPNNLKDVYHFQLYGPNSPWYHTRLRPGTLEFLSNIDPFYELHICTFGARNYAHMIAQFLDENGRLFSHRILSRDECLNATSKKDNLKALFPDAKCGDSMVCIIDDREDVWNMASNLIQVKPYHFFQHTGDINAPPGLAKHELDGKGVDFKEIVKSKSKPSNKKEKEEVAEEQEEAEEEQEQEEEEKSEEPEPAATENKSNAEPENKENSNESKELEETEAKPKSTEEQNSSDTSEKTEESSSAEGLEAPSKKQEPEDNLIEVEDGDDYLLYLEHILKKIHQRFYEVFDKDKEIPDLKTLIPQVKSEVMVGISIVFSGLVPNHLKLQHSKPYQIARSLGAKVTESFDEKTTHLVAATTGTNKVNMARKNKKIKIVTPDWLWTCAERWEHVDERLYPLSASKTNKMRQPPSHCQSPQHNANYMNEEEKPKFMDTINPLLSFSNDDIDAMNEEFDEFFESDSSSDDEPRDMENPPMQRSLKKRKLQEENKDNQKIFFKNEGGEKVELNLSKSSKPKTEEDESSSSSSSSNSEKEEDDEMPSTKFRRGEDLPSDLDMDNSEDDSDKESGEANDIDDSDWNMLGAELEREFLGSD